MRYAIFVFVVLLFGCGSHPFVSNEPDAGPTDASVKFGDASVSFDDGGCIGLECRQTCASTSVSGTVYDPKGTTPLYNVLVYVPNAPLAPITDGPTCTACQGTVTAPLVHTTTDELGHFTLANMPDGDDVPLVLQLGKWRRHIVLPHVTACKDNTFNTKASSKDKSIESLVRLPRKQAEGSPSDNIPRMAVTTGACDFAECFLVNTIGIDATQFDKGGRVDIYDGAQSVVYPTSHGSATTNLYADLGTMMKYDILVNSCECQTYDRGAGYANALSYLNAGGRVFGTHFQYNLFASEVQCAGDATCKGAADLASVAQWRGNDNAAQRSEPYFINQTIPKGQAMAKWLYDVGGGTFGQVSLFDVRHDVDMVSAGATSWIQAGTANDYSSLYLSFNTPVEADAGAQCGRGVFSDVHVAGTSYTNFCENGLLAEDYAPNMNALEFLFFDLSSCVQDDKKPAVIPN
jgi:hypothetical protein